MLVLGSRYLETPVMSLQTGTRLATTSRALIDPTNLTIAAYEVEGDLLSERPSFIRIAEIREVASMGMIIDSNDDLIGVDDVIRIKQINDIDFKLVNMPVIDEQKHKLGKVSDYTIDSESFVIQQLHVRRGIIKGLTESSLLIHRSQVVKVTDNEVIVKSTAKKLKAEPVASQPRHEYVNPFRTPAPQADSVDQ